MFTYLSSSSTLFAIAAVFLGIWPYASSPLKSVHVVPAAPALPTLPPNTLLEAAEHLFGDDLIGPEALVLDQSGSIITGLADGRVVKVFTDHDGSLRYSVLARTGADDPRCGSSIEFEDLCGRPLGLALSHDDKILFIADAARGLFSLDMDTLEMSLLANETSDGQPIILPNAIEMSTDGKTLFLTDTSSQYRRNRIFWAALSGSPTGRLLSYHFSNKSVEVLADGLLMPNGIIYDHEFKCLLIAMTYTGEVMRYCPQDPEPTPTAFAQNLPGTLDNIHRYTDPATGKKSYLLGLGSKRAKPFSLLHFLSPFPSVRRWICGLPLPYEMLYKLIPLHGILAFVDTDGKLFHTLQDPTGRTSWLSEAILVNGSLWAGSWLNPHLVRLGCWGSEQSERCSGPAGDAWRVTKAAFEAHFSSR